jgi:hypothetical protein
MTQTAVPPEQFFANYVLKMMRTGSNWFLYFIGVGMAYHWIAQKVYLKRLLASAGDLGLKYKPSEYTDQFGELCGSIEGYFVSVEIERDTCITIKSHCDDLIEDLDLKGGKSTLRPHEGQIDFSTGNIIFDFIFRTRRADIKTGQALMKASDLIDHFVAFYNKWMSRTPWFYLDRGTLTCMLNYGYPFTPYVPDDVLKELLPDVVELMIHFDRTIKEGRKL